MATALRRVWPGRADVWLVLAAATATLPHVIERLTERADKVGL
jgi:hypothetical protein